MSVNFLKNSEILLVKSKNFSWKSQKCSWKVQKDYLRNPGTSLSKNRNVLEKFCKKKLKKSEWKRLGFDPTISRLAVERAKLCKSLDLFQERQKDDLCRQQSAWLRRKFSENSPGACLKEDRRSKLLCDKEKLKF